MVCTFIYESRRLKRAKRIALEALRPRQGLNQLHGTPYDRTATYIPRHRYQVDGVNEVPSTERPAVQLLTGISQRPAIARSIHRESERLIPSIENDPQAHVSQEPSPRGTQPSNSDGHFQDRFIGPRIIQLHDDATSPAQKRRRVEDAVAPSSKVTYKPIRDQASSAPMFSGPGYYNGRLFSEARPSGLLQQKRPQYNQGASRPTESVPNIVRTHHIAGANPFDGVSHRVSRDAAQEKHATYASAGMRYEDEQQLYSPALQPQSELSEGFPLDPNSRLNVFRFMPPSDTHEPGTLLPSQFTISSPPSHTDPPNYVGVRQCSQPRNRGFQAAPVRLKPLEPVGQPAKRHTYFKPAFDCAYEAPGRIPALATELPNHTLEPTRQSYEHYEGMLPFSPPRRTDCPEGARGSFCNRVGENGFTRMDHLDEHLRTVHLLESRVLRPALERDASGHSSRIYANETYAERPRNLQRGSYHQRSRDQEVIYINSSPLVEER